MKIRASSPPVFHGVNETITNVQDTAKRIQEKLKSLISVFENREALRRKMSDEGNPGSEEAFMGPVYDLEDEAERLVAIANIIRNSTFLLKNRNVESWGD